MKTTKDKSKYLLMRYWYNPYLNNAILVTLDEDTITHLRAMKAAMDDLPKVIKLELKRIEFSYSIGDYLYIQKGKYDSIDAWLDGSDQYCYLEATKEEIDELIEQNESDNVTHYTMSIYGDGTIQLSLIGNDNEYLEFFSYTLPLFDDIAETHDHVEKSLTSATH